MICTYGPLISDARGKIGGTVFTRCRSGAFARINRVPVFNQTNRRSAWASAMTYVYINWLNGLSPAQRAGWNTLGDNTTFTNGLGANYHPSGWNLFLRYNAVRMYFKGTYRKTAPGAAVGPHFAVTYTTPGPPYTIHAQVHASYQDLDLIAFWATKGRPPTQYSFSGTYLLDYYNTGAVLKANPTEIFSHVYDSGDRVFLRDRNIAYDGSLSAPYFQIVDIP